MPHGIHPFTDFLECLDMNEFDVAIVRGGSSVRIDFSNAEYGTVRLFSHCGLDDEINVLADSESVVVVAVLDALPTVSAERFALDDGELISDVFFQEHHAERVLAEVNGDRDALADFLQEYLY